MNKQPTRLSQTDQDPDTYCGVLYSGEYRIGNQTYCDGLSGYLSWEAAHEALVSKLSRLTASELEYVYKPTVCEERWDNGACDVVAAREISIKTFDWKN